uniref:Uncharacterized protein n=1 Tax=Anguilla anguilla TaxID=7936 RepID=A0A0E9TXT9_ANGAN
MKPSEAKRQPDSARSRTRVNLGIAFPLWRQRKFAKGMKKRFGVGLFSVEPICNVTSACPASYVR